MRLLSIPCLTNDHRFVELSQPARNFPTIWPQPWGFPTATMPLDMNSSDTYDSPDSSPDPYATTSSPQWPPSIHRPLLPPFRPSNPWSPHRLHPCQKGTRHTKAFRPDVRDHPSTPYRFRANSHRVLHSQRLRHLLLRPHNRHWRGPLQNIRHTRPIPVAYVRESNQ